MLEAANFTWDQVSWRRRRRSAEVSVKVDGGEDDVDMFGDVFWDGVRLASCVMKW